MGLILQDRGRPENGRRHIGIGDRPGNGQGGKAGVQFGCDGFELFDLADPVFFQPPSLQPIEAFEDTTYEVRSQFGIGLCIVKEIDPRS